MTSPTTSGTLPLADLRPGHKYPGASINSRITGRSEEIEQLAASIEHEGLLIPLIVVPGPKKDVYYVVDGNRRLAALHSLVNRRAMALDSAIDVRVETSLNAADALRRSLAANMHLPLHPVDRYETFAALYAGNASPAEIAKRYGITERQVGQSLALGALAPKIRDAWRAGTITADIAQAFTLADDQEDQVKQFDKIEKKGGWRWVKANNVRQLFTGSEALGKRLLGFVGREAYEAADGKLTEDLFGEGFNIHHMPKLKKLAQKKLDDECARLTADGWSWAEGQLSDRTSGYYNFDRMKAKATYTADERKRLDEIKAKLKSLGDIDMGVLRDGDPLIDKTAREEDALDEERERIEGLALVRAFSPAQKAKAGCIVMIGSTGALRIEAGLVKRKGADGDAAGAQPARPKQEEPPLAHETARAVAAWKSRAAGAVLANDESLGLAALLAALATGGGPVDIQVGYQTQGELELTRARTFKAAFAEFRKIKTGKLAKMLAQTVGLAIRLGTGWDEDGDNDVLVSALDQQAFARRIAEEWDAKIYFAGASKKHLLDVIGEALGPDERRRNEAKGQKELQKFAVASVAPTGWLPETLRTAKYTGPAKGKVMKLAAKKPKAARAKKTAAPKRRAA